MRKTLLVCIALTLPGCNSIYQTYSITDDINSNVRVVYLTPETVLEANSSLYEPKSLPDLSFSSNKVNDQTNSLMPLLNPTPDIQHYLDAVEIKLPETVQPKAYLIGVGDVLILSTPEATDIVEALNGLLASQNRRQGYTVQDDGAVSIPDIGRIVVGGLTLQEAEDAVFQKLLELGMAPSFSIEIAEFNSQRVSIGGAVVSPGVEPISLQPLYLGQAISRRGGISINDKDFVIIRLYRNGSIYQLSVAELYNQGRLFKIPLNDGDRVVVETTKEYDQQLGLRQKARSNILKERELEMEASANAARSIQIRLQYEAIPRDYAYIIGEVGTQSRFTLPFESVAVLADALLKSGGLLSLSGNPQQIYILRGFSDLTKNEAITAFHLDARIATNFLLATRLELRPKDVVYVGSQPVTNWNRMINQFLPSLQFSRM
tara:strand:+ start:737 stop:2032 length:1296 start_codon:yes stop_codon:yes gene_type:complete